MTFDNSTDPVRGGNTKNTGQYSIHTNTRPDPSVDLKPAPTVAVLRARITKAEKAQERLGVQIKEAAVEAVRILAKERFPTADEVEFRKEYNQTHFTLTRANQDHEIIWESDDPSTHNAATKGPDKALQANMNGLMTKVGGDAPRYVERIDDVIGETVVFRF